MNIDYKVGEVKLSYKPQFKNQQKVTCSEDAYRYMLSTISVPLKSGQININQTIPEKGKN